MKAIEARPVCTICTQATVDTDTKLASGTGFQVRCDAGHITNGMPPVELCNRTDVSWVRI